MRLKHLLLAIVTCGLFPLTSYADWQLDNEQSALSFVSIKNGTVFETHTFTQLNGKVDSNGLATLNVEVNSVETMIPIRNERMQKMLFSAGKYPLATATVQLDPSIVTELASSRSSQRIEISGQLSIKGMNQRVSAKMLATTTADGGMLLTTTSPILINASDYELNAGIEALREVAGLGSITPVVPVTLSLKFVPAITRSSTTAPVSSGQSTNIE